MSLKIAALLASAAAAVGCAIALAPVAHADVVPLFAEAPTVADMVAAYPAKAKAANVGGTVTLTCEVGRDMHPRDCAALKEKPGSYGFALAAQKVAEKLKVDGVGLIGKNVFIPVTFDPNILGDTPMVTKLSWSAQPSLADYQETFPKTQNGVNDVRVVLGCTVESGGALGACSVAQETPAGQGYGEGALSLASKFRVAPWGSDGSPTVGAHIRLPIHYELVPVKAP